MAKLELELPVYPSCTELKYQPYNCNYISQEIAKFIRDHTKNVPANAISIPTGGTSILEQLGSKINASIKSVFSSKFRNILKDGDVYIMSQFNVVSASSSFHPTRHAFKLNFIFQTQVALFDDADVIGRVYNMSQVHQSSPNDSKNKRVTVDIEYAVYKIEVIVYDESGIANLTVFDRDAFKYLGINAIDLGAESVKNVEDNEGWPKKLDSFVGKKFIFKVGIKVLEWNAFTSLTVQKMTDDPTIFDKYFVHRLPQIDLTLVTDDLPTLDMNKSKQMLRGDGRRLSFHDVEASPSKEKPSTCKRPAIDFSDDGQSSGEFMLNIDDAHKKVEIENN
ncbi:replication protein A 70 kDa DNA-binding subunit E-like [Senna tora]|uniref:Replication protein A 70 kDa DNA-binding subunit E-like n=1 Tax=Senna tora TaxID=362788 RepID=A0A834SMI2_9FABA|nr:replication protein A 70 kDa DNA-binding subunit E-like [Senna tora]